MPKYNAIHHRHNYKVGPSSRAIAMWVVLKNTYVNGSIVGWTYEKVGGMIGASRSTARKYVAILMRLGMVALEDSGRRKERNLRLLSCKDRHGHNYDLSVLDNYRYDPDIADRCRTEDDRAEYRRMLRKQFRELHALLMGLHIIDTTLKKEKLKDLFRVARDPRPGEDTRRARRALRRLGYSAEGVFRDRGETYGHISSSMSCSPTTAQRYVSLNDGLLFTRTSGAVPLPEWCLGVYFHFGADVMREMFFKDGYDHSGDRYFIWGGRLYWGRPNRYYPMELGIELGRERRGALGLVNIR